MNTLVLALLALIVTAAVFLGLAYRRRRTRIKSSYWLKCYKNAATEDARARALAGLHQEERWTLRKITLATGLAPTELEPIITRGIWLAALETNHHPTPQQPEPDPTPAPKLQGTPTDPADLQLLKMLKGAHFAPGTEVILPSGQSITGQQARELSTDS
ncbi:Uncharacterised protein [Mycobacteroides abscessus subsp. abscessus]|uniref:hypothetical protein n=1 Tax=Mycobacteroides abscessus TaxID=36809 RepID=UPI000928AA1B|nr:hypothetical protein [Mycobacteroides abscessus]SHU69514.1 Uncharacterised protein [Mycobacteroides abscessus subsp. abscessus]